MMQISNWYQVGLLFLLLLPTAVAQQQPTTAAPQPGTQVTVTTGNPQTPAGTETIRPNYILNSGDQILIRAFEVEEISDKPYRIDTAGDVTLPILGKIHAAGLTVEQLEADLTTRLKALVKNPQVTISVVQFRNEPVFFEGAFKNPGIYPLQGRRTLVEMLTGLGGLQSNASRRLKITRHIEYGKLPLPNAIESADGKTTSAEISMGSLRDNVNPAEDIVLQPFDFISVERAEMVYVNGEVGRVGGIELGERDSISTIQLITLSGGLARDADPEKALILRPISDTDRRAEIPIDLKKVLSGKANDFPLLPNDMLYVPKAKFKDAWKKVAIFAVPLAIPVIIALALR